MRCLLSTYMWTVTQFYLYLCESVIVKTQIFIGLPSLPHVMSTQRCRVWTRLAPIGTNFELFMISFHYIRWTKMTRNWSLKVSDFFHLGPNLTYLIETRPKFTVDNVCIVLCEFVRVSCYPMSVVITIISQTHTEFNRS